MRRLGFNKWIIKLVQAMYYNASSKVHIENCFSDNFCVNGGVLQGSVLSPISLSLRSLELDALGSCCTLMILWRWCWYSVELCLKLITWKVDLENKGLRVNMKKTKVMFSGQNKNMLLNFSMWPCGVCWSAVGSNSIFCTRGKHWMHNKRTKIHGRLVENVRFRCDRCCSIARPINGRKEDST